MYEGALAGWLVLALKVSVILPLIKGIRSYWKLRMEMPKLRI